MGPQVQDPGDGGDASSLGDQQEGSEHRCRTCSKLYRVNGGLRGLRAHEQKCSERFREGDEGLSWVSCELCGFKGKSLAGHIRKIHGMTKHEYAAAHPGSPTMCSSSKSAYSEQNAENGNWIGRANAAGVDLSDFKKKMGNSVSRAIMGNEEERRRRAGVLTRLNKSEDFRHRSSITAQETSKQPHVLKSRTERLQAWRDNNREKFYEKCTSAALKKKTSKPEKILLSFLQSVEGYSFKGNQVVKSETFSTKSKRKQIDMADKLKRVYVEFDGIIHFDPRVKGLENLIASQERDRMLDDHIVKHGWTLIRVSYDQFSYKRGGTFDENCLESIRKVLKDPLPGVFRIGSAYSAVQKTSAASYDGGEDTRE